MAGTSRMNREIHVRFCGRLEVKFLRSTRHLEHTQVCEPPVEAEQWIVVAAKIFG